MRVFNRALGFLVLFTLAAHADSGSTIYSKTAIPEGCDRAYLAGQAAFQEAVSIGVLEKGPAALADALDRKLATFSTPDCSYAFSIGAFDAQGVFQQSVILESLLEAQDSQENSPVLREKKRQFFIKRLKASGLPDEVIAKFSPETAESLQALTKFTNDMNAYAKEKQQAISFGRFVFVSAENPRPFTLYEYARKPDGEIVLDANAKPVVLPGSYQRMAEGLWNRSRALTEEYLKWRPGIIYGEDSLWFGSFWRAIGTYKGPIPREIKEEMYQTAMRRMIQHASRNNLKTEPFYQLYQIMLKKERAYLDRDSAIYKRIQYGLYAAPLIPVGMYVGAAGFAYAGLSATTAANTSALFSLGTLATFSGLGGKNALDAYRDSRKHNVPFHLSNAMDYVVASAVSSFPLVAAMPAIAGGTAAAGKFAVVSVKELVAGTTHLLRTAQTLGFRGTLQALPKLPAQAVRAWATAWWKNKFLFVQFASDVTINTVFEIGYRQFFLEGKDKFYYVDENGKAHINQQTLITIGTGVIFGAITKPIILMPTFAARFWTYRAVTLFSGIVSQLAITGHINKDRLIYDQLNGIIIGVPMGELGRGVKLSGFVQNQNRARQFGLTLVFDGVAKLAGVPARVYFQDRFLDGRLKPIDMIRQFLIEQYFLDLSDFSDAEIWEALEKL